MNAVMATITVTATNPAVRIEATLWWPPCGSGRAAEAARAACRYLFSKATRAAAMTAPITSEPAKRAFTAFVLPGRRAVRRVGSSVFFIGAVFSFSGARA